MATATRLSSNGTSWSSPGTTVVSSSITPGTDCFLVALVCAVHDGTLTSDQHPGTLVSSGSGPSWTSRADSTPSAAFDAQGSVWTAAIGGSDPGSFTVTWTRALSDSCGVRVMSIWKITGHDTGTPQAGAIAIRSDTANGARTENVGATPASGDIVIMQALADDDDGNNSTITLSNANRTWTDAHGGATTTIGAPWVTAQSTASTSTAVDASDMNPGDTHDYTSAMCAIIVKAVAALPPTSLVPRSARIRRILLRRR